MLRQRGFITLGPMVYAALAAGIAILGLTIALKVQTARLDAEKAEHKAFVEHTRAIGVAQEARAKRIAEQDKTRKEKADAENTITRARLDDALRKLRDNRPGGSFVPPAPAGAGRPDLACYDRAEFVGAVGKFVEGLRGLADEGSKAAVDLNTAKKWAQEKNGDR